MKRLRTRIFVYHIYYINIILFCFLLYLTFKLFIRLVMSDINKYSSKYINATILLFILSKRKRGYVIYKVTVIKRLNNNNGDEEGKAVGL